MKAHLVRQFKGRTASVEEIQEYILVHTPYRETHYKKQVLKPMEQGPSPELAIRAAPPGRKKGQFPEGTVIEFF